MFWAEIWKNETYDLIIFIFGGKIFNIFEKACFRNDNESTTLERTIVNY